MLQRLSLSLVCTINWGVRITSHNDQLLSEITHVETEISRVRSTTDNLQDIFPFFVSFHILLGNGRRPNTVKGVTDI